MKIIKTKANFFNISHAIVWSILAHLFFFNYLPDFSSMDSVEPKRKLEKVRLDIIKKKAPLKNLKKEPKKITTKKEVFSKPIKPIERARKITNSKIKPLSIPSVQKKPLMAKATSRAPRNFSNLKPLPVISLAPIEKVVSKDYAVRLYTSKVTESSNSSLSKVFYDLKPKDSTPIVASSMVSPREIAHRQSSKRVFVSSFSPTPLPIKDIEIEREKENSLSKEELDGIWRQYTNSIQVKIAKAKNYPALAKRREQQGKAILSFKLSRDGNVLDLIVEKSTGHKRLDQAALRAVKEGGPYPTIPKALSREYAFLKIPISFVINLR